MGGDHILYTMDMLNNCKPSCSRVGALLASLNHKVQQLCSTNIKKPQIEQNPIYAQCLSILNKGVQLVKKCEKTSRFNIFQNLRYASEIHQPENEICDFVQYQMPAQLSTQLSPQLSLELKNLISEFKSLCHMYKLGALDERKVNETIVPQLTNDLQENAIILQQMGPDGIFHGAFDEAPPCAYIGSGKSDFVAGLDKNNFNLKRIMLQREVSVVAVQGMGGVCETTMGMALCNDQEIKGAFRNNVGDARRQLQQQLLWQARRTLVVLDDVWSRANLEKMLFEGEGYKPLVTTRDRSTVPTTNSIRLYELPLLDDADALLLFCFWDFGQRSILSNADEQLIKQVQAECKGLPLALKLIGRSLHSEPRLAWESGNNELLNGESILDYDKEGLLRCLETSIDVLDEEARGCFLDLRSFSEDRNILVDALSNILVYNGSGKSDFVVGLEKNSFNLKRILLQRELSVVGVQSIGGVRKTAMAVALCNDQEVKDAFRNNIIFITVSQCPNLKGILEIIWVKIVRRKKLEFQNIEYAHRQLQKHLLRQAKRTLVVLDDVWSRDNLEKLLFEGGGYKTRDRSTVPTTTSTRLYELPLLDDADVLPLFYFWAFGQRSIPSNADKQLVKQVQAECKGLPLALKVIGSSLHSEHRLAQESGKRKVLNGESISDYHKEGLLRCLETSIDVLDEEAWECFLDLGSFPEDRKISVDALPDISVYNGSGKSDFVGGLEKNNFNLNGILLEREVCVVEVQGMEGVGKTTMAIALWNDQEVKDAFRNNSIFITVSQSSNLKGILEIMWEKIVWRKKPEFQNVEDAHRQLRQQLLRQAKRTLVVLDDIWSRENMKKLLFEGEVYKTQDCSTVPTTTSTQLYELPLLDDADVLPLFCFWAFGQGSIPSNADKQLVKQVQAEGKGLPLALKVIGISLHSEPRLVWENGKNKLVNGESVSDYDKEGFLRCLETSIDVLDDEAWECFLDLGSFPEDRKISVDALSDISVYSGSVKSDFLVGLEKNNFNLKRILLQREVCVAGVQGMGSVGKTTMAIALCNDQEVKDDFQNNIIFITVSLSPNLKGILETMWEKIVRRKKPEFQNVEDAQRQQQQLLRQAKRTLVVLDDIWSRANLEKSLFEGEGYKSLVTTWDCSTIPTKTSTRLYELPLLDDANALPLLCFWAFGERSIPSNADEQLVKQVQIECKGLPLALKVIGSSLHSEPHLAWESGKN